MFVHNDHWLYQVGYYYYYYYYYYYFKTYFMSTTAGHSWSAAARLMGLRVRILPKARMSVLSAVCVVRYRPLRRADNPSREVPPSAVYLSVFVKPR
jgi:hypothetical protein